MSEKQCLEFLAYGRKDSCYCDENGGYGYKDENGTGQFFASDGSWCHVDEEGNAVCYGTDGSMTCVGPYGKPMRFDANGNYMESEEEKSNREEMFELIGVVIKGINYIVKAVKNKFVKIKNKKDLNLKETKI